MHGKVVKHGGVGEQRVRESEGKYDGSSGPHTAIRGVLRGAAMDSSSVQFYLRWKNHVPCWDLKDRLAKGGLSPLSWNHFLTPQNLVG